MTVTYATMRHTNGSAAVYAVCRASVHQNEDGGQFVLIESGDLARYRTTEHNILRSDLLELAQRHETADAPAYQFPETKWDRFDEEWRDIFPHREPLFSAVTTGA